MSIRSLIFTGLLAATTSGLPTSEQSNVQDRDIGKAGRVGNFKDIPASSELHWTPCYDKFFCANLQVPLDYADPSAGNTTVAWIRQESANSTGIDILFNPGGPGGSGIQYVLSGGGDSIINASGGKYNVVSFDPRGVNNSAIALTCFPGQPKIRDAYYSSGGAGVNTEFEKYAHAVAQGKFCTAANNGTKTKYAGTSAVVQDMMHFTELQAAQDKKNPKEALIYYYGVSYGTVIGHTLAAMYPDRIGRIIVDSNVNSEEHYNGMSDTAVENTDNGLRYFFGLCAEAGEKKCAFAGSSKTADELEKRFDALMAKLEKEPLQSFDLKAGVPSIITKDRVLSLIFSALYSPGAYFPYMAFGLNALDKGNATAWLSLESQLDRPDQSGPFNYTRIAMQEVLTLVTAVDAAGRYGIHNVDEYTKAVDEIEASSHWFGEGYAGLNPLNNAGMNIVPPKSQLFEGFKTTKTRVPLLFINTNADPITPLSSAKHMVKYFPGSVVLTQNSGGHSFTGLASKCTIGHLQAYLETGNVPKEGTICEAGWKPLVETRPSVVRREVLLPRAWKEVA